jgi:hypothetical protein
MRLALQPACAGNKKYLATMLACLSFNLCSEQAHVLHDDALSHLHCCLLCCMLCCCPAAPRHQHS